MWTGTNGLQLAIASCPQDKETCPGDKLISLANKETTAIKRNIELKDASTDSCSYVLETLCDSPGFHISDTASAVTDNDITFSVIDYDLTFRADSSETPTIFKNGIFT